jgi:hypothetical protein
VGRLVESGIDGFAEHRVAWFFEGDEDAEFGFFAFDGADEVAHVADLYAARFHRQDDLLQFALSVVAEEKFAVDAAVGAFFARSYASERNFYVVFYFLYDAGFFGGLFFESPYPGIEPLINFLLILVSDLPVELSNSKLCRRS